MWPRRAPRRPPEPELCVPLFQTPRLGIVIVETDKSAHRGDLIDVPNQSENRRAVRLGATRSDPTSPCGPPPVLTLEKGVWGGATLSP